MPASGAVRRVHLLADDALQPDLAGPPPHRRRRPRDMVAVAQQTVPLAERREQPLAGQQAAGTKIPAIQVQQVEQEEGKSGIVPGRERRLQIGKAGNAVGPQRHQLAVEQRRADGQCCDGTRHGRQAFAPVEAVAGEQARHAGFEKGEQPIAVELDLADPVGTLGRLLGERAELRGLAGRQLAADCAGWGRQGFTAGSRPLASIPPSREVISAE